MSCLVLIIVALVVGPGLWYLADRLATGIPLVDLALHGAALGLWLVCVVRIALSLDQERDSRDRRRLGSDLDES